MEDHGHTCGHLAEIARLREQNARLRANVRTQQVALERKNRELDALHYVWCDGGCPRGVHRWHDDLILTEDLVKLAERNTKRLRNWYRAVQFRLALKNPGEWLRKYTLRAAARTDMGPRDDSAA